MTKTCRQGLEGQSIEIANLLSNIVLQAQQQEARVAEPKPAKNSLAEQVLQKSEFTDAERKVLERFYTRSGEGFRNKVDYIVENNSSVEKAEAIGFASYIGLEYANINKVLYSSEEGVAKMSASKKLLHTALAKGAYRTVEKLPKITAADVEAIADKANEGNDGLLHRYMTLNDKGVDSMFGGLEEGDEFTFDAFCSTTTETKTSRRLPGIVSNANVEIVIGNLTDATLAKNGAIHADKWKNSLNEYEILFNAGCKTVVRKKEIIRRGYFRSTKIWLDLV